MLLTCRHLLASKPPVRAAELARVGGPKQWHTFSLEASLDSQRRVVPLDVASEGLADLNTQFVV